MKDTCAGCQGPTSTKTEPWDEYWIYPVLYGHVKAKLCFTCWTTHRQGSNISELPNPKPNFLSMFEKAYGQK